MTLSKKYPETSLAKIKRLSFFFNSSVKAADQIICYLQVLIWYLFILPSHCFRNEMLRLGKCIFGERIGNSGIIARSLRKEIKKGNALNLTRIPQIPN